MPRRNYPRKRSTEDIRSLFTNVATTNHFEFQLLAFPGSLINFVQKREPLLSTYFLTRELNLLCKGAELPGATFATAQIKGNYMGVVQKYAHTRIFTDTTFTFIVDKGYKVMKFFQLWQEFIASGGEVSQDKKAFYNRMLYPDTYKCSQMGLTKFDKDHFQKLEYTFINAFPVNIVPSAVDYANNRVLEISVTFAYDRYVLGSIRSLERTSKSDQPKPGHREYSSNPRGDGERPEVTGPVPPAVDPPSSRQEEWNYPQFENGGKGTGSNFGNTYGPGSDFVPRDPATGVPI